MKKATRVFCFSIILLVGLLPLNVYSASSDALPNIDTGARVFIDRCVLCHGTHGMGEGNMPLKLRDYPSTNLLRNSKTQDYQQVYDAVSVGGTGASKLSNLMPPMGNELTWTELESVVRFVVLLRNDMPLAQKKLERESASLTPSLKMGRQVFSNRCVLCHGKYGEGDGRMARIITAPPPFNLTISVVNDKYLEKIIAGGGESVGRSKQMPPWKDQLNVAQIESLILYLKTLRASQ